MRDDEGSRSTGRILRHAHLEEIRRKSLHHVEVQPDRRTVVLDIPCTEHQLMLARLQLRNAVISGTTGIASEIIREMIVEHIGLRHISIYHELQVMSDAAT